VKQLISFVVAMAFFFGGSFLFFDYSYLIYVWAGITNYIVIYGVIIIISYILGHTVRKWIKINKWLICGILVGFLLICVYGGFRANINDTKDIIRLTIIVVISQGIVGISFLLGLINLHQYIAVKYRSHKYS
jgi:hypothetical protein